ncbi:hypothetical protein LPJ53_005538 [Coemansia erecta]|uniref:Pacifastin domain-containing protein n=1 Tax=Coemansia erecta TaxID=147472 RepID=A0A9W8CQE3_9FUNG|nr:hypothetical protein LPJ53_005538 [Coemansia erecta]
MLPPRTTLLAMLAALTSLAPLAALAALPANTGDAPVWFTRVPSILTAQDIHDTSYLQCKMAHNGRTEWLSTEYPGTEAHTDGAKACTRCFCLPDTHQIGCAPTECGKESRKLVRRHRPAATRSAKQVVLYVNHEACVKAREAAAHRGVLCACRQNGALECPVE